MKRAPYPTFQSQDGKRWWQSLRELDESPAFQEELRREFPDGAAEPPDGVSRRTFFRLAGASFAMAGLAACRRPDERILPYARAPEDVVPGNPLFFATAMPWNGTAIGLLVESHEGRPTKIEGNPRHPESLGATNTFAQAEVLNLWDPDRSNAPTQRDNPRDWEGALAAVAELGRAARGRGGQGVAILTEAHRSPTTARVLAKVKEAMPRVQIFRYDPWARDNARAGAQLAFGRPLEAVYDVAKARAVVSLDADFLTSDAGSAVRYARGLSEARNRLTPAEMVRVYAVESAFSVTGAMADHRIPLPSRKVADFAFALARELGIEGAPARPVPPPAQKAVQAIAADLKRAQGKAIVVAGEKQPAAVHAFAHLINAALGKETVAYVQPFDDGFDGARSIGALARAMDGGQVSTLVILGGNPAFDAPGDSGFVESLPRVENVVHLSQHRDETSRLARWHLPRAHFLESWGDVRALDGTLSIIQPLIAPLYDGKTDGELLAVFLGQPEKAYDQVRATLKQDDEFEKTWRRALHDGFWADSEYPRVQVAGNPQPLGPALAEATQEGAGIEVTYSPDSHTWDGRYANNPWMQELPDAMTKLTWGNAAHVSPATAARMGVVDGDEIDLGANVIIPVLVMPGQADDSIALTFGQGRRGGRVADGVGVNVHRLRGVNAFYIGSVAKPIKTGGREKLARTQEHFNMEHRAPVREGTLVAFAQDPKSAAKPPHAEHKLPLFNLWDPPEGDPYWQYKGRKWALAIDLNTCTGCGACVVACVAENNILQVGAEGVKISREMHWIRVDRYFEGDPRKGEAVRSVTQPMTCQQCENAPCEQVCPVQATTHSPEGLNDMAYNRCIGTKYCLNNCPFKVRRFNYFHYAKRDPNDSEQRKAQYNPDVTVRSRGVMEKCTYCVQRINSAKIAAHRNGTEEIADGTIVTACQQACPPQALVFGDLNNPQSRVAKLKAEPRAYTLLDEINVRARTTYLARVHNPNPELA